MGFIGRAMKAGKVAVTAYKKSKADQIADAAKKLKEKEAAAKKAKELKTAFDKGKEVGKIKGKKSVKRKIVGAAALAGASYYEAKTGNISKGVGKMIDNALKPAKPKTKVSMKQALKDKKPVGFSKTGVIGKLKEGKKI